MKAVRFSLKLTYPPAASTPSIRSLAAPLSREATSPAICAGFRRSCFASVKQGIA